MEMHPKALQVTGSHKFLLPEENIEPLDAQEMKSCWY
jgi:hypothetical protein